ncbi:DUF1857-domain-containing protein [Massarina eburnea CBS 473.64]|uniref:DUF1857-domain-containing protein n=1 Tax=Massarina eburnea CBS 473.64 TaxID=1395130 RepID=A0A6A6RIP8_9PLEO|nr:DUF1857-domain-containing protein [Massarina eburnea CBS 473.64]
MVLIPIAHTTPINPPTTTPTLTHQQIWTGLLRKIHHAEEFVPIISSCEVLSDTDGVVERVVTFKEGQFARREARETVRCFGREWVDFEQSDGTRIRNVVGRGGGGGELYMSYMFEVLVEGEEGSDGVEGERGRLRDMAKKAVESSIDTIRAMVKDGRIPAE